MDVGTLLVIFSFYVYVVYASAFRQAENGLAPRSPITTAPPQLDGRDVSSICGIYSDPVTTSLISTWTCNDGLPCVIDRYVTPNVVFCSIAALIPYTKFYSYGGWPQGGCKIREYCCPSTAPNVATLIYDNGASYYYQCDSSAPQTISIYTQLQEYSVYLSPYTTIDVATSTSTPAAAQGATLIPSITTSLRSASSTTASGSGTTVPQTSSNNSNPKIALAAGLGVAIPIALVAGIVTIFLIRRSKQATTQKADPPMSYPQSYYRSYPPNELNGNSIDPRAPQSPAMHELNGNDMNEPSTQDTQKDPSQPLAELDGR